MRTTNTRAGRCATWPARCQITSFCGQHCRDSSDFMMAHRGPPVYISAAEVKELVSMKDIITAVGKSMELASAGEEGGVVQPVRTTTTVKKQDGYNIYIISS